LWRDAGRVGGTWRGLGWGGGDGEEFFVVFDGAGERAGLHSYGGAGGVARFADDFKDAEAVLGLVGLDVFARLVGFFLVENGDAEIAIADGGNADEGVVIEGVRGIHPVRRWGLGGEGGVVPEAAVAADGGFFRQVRGGPTGEGEQEKDLKFEI
jgi:hypothetical protein